jgi:hypothetical protein
MGCDIHMVLEGRSRAHYHYNEDEEGDGGMGRGGAPEALARLTGMGPWHVVLRNEGCPTARNYVLFTALAGVRDSHGVVPISEPRGLPGDLSEEARKFLDDNFHSASWLTLDEVIQGMPAAIAGRPPTLEHVGDFVAWCKALKDSTSYKLDEVRIVFAFDN